jgi:hypothetical protein
VSTTGQPEDDQHPAILRGDAGVAFLRYGIMPWGGSVYQWTVRYRDGGWGNALTTLSLGSRYCARLSTNDLDVSTEYPMTNAVLIKVTRCVSLLGCCMLAGIAGTVLVLELALRRLNGQEYAHIRQAEFVFFTPFIGAVLLPTLLAVAMLVIHARQTRGPTLRPTAVAFAMLVLALLISLTVNGPINVEQQSWNLQALPPDWARIRDLWQIAHAVRTVAIVFALGYLCAAFWTAGVPAVPDAIKDRDD